MATKHFALLLTPLYLHSLLLPDSCRLKILVLHPVGSWACRYKWHSSCEFYNRMWRLRTLLLSLKPCLILSKNVVPKKGYKGTVQFNEPENEAVSSKTVIGLRISQILFRHEFCVFFHAIRKYSREIFTPIFRKIQCGFRLKTFTLLSSFLLKATADINNHLDPFVFLF